jgi:hypothetical protein
MPTMPGSLASPLQKLGGLARRNGVTAAGLTGTKLHELDCRPSVRLLRL